MSATASWELCPSIVSLSHSHGWLRLHETSSRRHGRYEQYQCCKRLDSRIIDLALLFIAVGVVVIIFGPDVEYFSAITKNLMAFISELGTNGFVGLIALFVIVWVFTKGGQTQNG